MEVWIPLLQSLVWPLFIGLLILFFRGWFRELLDAIKKRVESGSEVSVGPGGFTLGSAPKMDDPKDAPAPSSALVERFVEEARKMPPQSEAMLDMSKYFQLVHSASYSPGYSKQQGQAFYTIKVRLEADSAELLQRVRKVVYHLHPTFPHPDREVANRENNFELQLTAWGQFNLSADVYFDDQTQPLRLFRYLNL